MRVRLAVAAGAGLALAAGLLVVRAADPGAGVFYPRCLFHEVTGLHCPGCGSTRCLHALLNLAPVEALRKNPLLVVLLPFVAVGGALEVAAWVRGEGRAGPRARLPAGGTWVLLGVIALYWIARNIPAWPFSVLAPH